MKRQNCWEFMKCGHELGGKKEKTGICPVSMENGTDRIHGGINGGRACWAIAKTLCGGKTQGAVAEKIGDCLVDCDFYKEVSEEEGENLKFSDDIVCKLDPNCPKRG